MVATVQKRHRRRASWMPWLSSCEVSTATTGVWPSPTCASGFRTDVASRDSSWHRHHHQQLKQVDWTRASVKAVSGQCPASDVSTGRRPETAYRKRWPGWPDTASRRQISPTHCSVVRRIQHFELSFAVLLSGLLNISSSIIIYSTLFVENDSKKQQKQQQTDRQTDRQATMTMTIERAQSATVADKAKSS